MAHKNFTKTIIVFIALTLAGIGLIVFPQSASQEMVRTTLPLVGTALFGSGLTFFMVEMFRVYDK